MDMTAGTLILAVGAAGGLLGGSVVLAAFLAGWLLGRQGRPDRIRAPAAVPDADALRRAREEADAFQRMTEYSPEDAYGRSAGTGDGGWTSA